LATGGHYGVLVLEADGEAGLDSLLALCNDDWSWLDTLRTAANQKRFIFFAWSEGRREREGSLCIGRELRVLGEGDWLLMPPSRENGIQHVYLNPQLTLLVPPAWLIDLIFKSDCDIDPLNSFVPSNSNCDPLPDKARI
jgi:hypothetical protein